MAITMIMENTSTVTSTSFKIKDLLLRAWRERWSEIEWGRNIKRLLRGVSGDVYDLADCMLRQAINGPVTNNLLMLYLNHCLDSQIVSFGACIMAIAKITDLKPQCINSLLDFLIRYKTRTNCYGIDDECLALCRALVTFLHWLYSIIRNSFDEMKENPPLNDHLQLLSGNNQSNSTNSVLFDSDNIHGQIVQKAFHLLTYIGNCSYLKALLYIGKMEEQQLWKKWIKLHHELSSRLLILSGNSSTDKSLQSFVDFLNKFQSKIEWLDISQFDNTKWYEVGFTPSADTQAIWVAYRWTTTNPESGHIPYRPLSYHSVRLLISFYAVLDPSCSNELLADYLAIIGRTFNLTLPKLYCETLHTCLVGLIDTHSLAKEDRKDINYHAWIAFLLFKIPQIFLQLSKHRIQLRKEQIKDLNSSGENNQNTNNNNNNDQSTKTDLEIGIDMLLDFGPCIDQFLLRYRTEHLQKLFDCFKEPQINLLSSSAVDRYVRIINRRMLSSSNDSNSFAPMIGNEEQSLNNTNGNQQAQQSTSNDALSSILIYRAERTVISILAPLYMDTNKIESMAGIICRMQSSFDIILCAAASNGMLPKFAQRLMELNRTNTSSRGESGRSSQIRAIMFDLTFVSLCSLVERYGYEVIDSTTTRNDSSSENTNTFFFSNWCRWNLPSSNVCYAPKIILSSYPDSNKFDHLIQQLVVSSNSVEFRTSLISWDEMCMAAQFASSEVLNAWIHDLIGKETVKLFLERLKSRLCCLALSAACWLFAKLRTISVDHQSKVIFMLNELKIPPQQIMDTALENFSDDANELNLAFGYKQRFLLMSSILNRLMTKYMPSMDGNVLDSSSSNKTLSSLSITLSKCPLNTHLEKCLHLTRNHLTLKLVHDFDVLLSLGGPKWFVSQIVKFLFNFNDASLAIMQDSVDLAYGLFHLDLEQCALTLLKYTLPEFLLSKSSEASLIEPKISALVQLTIITTYSAIEQLDKFRKMNLPKRCGHRRNYQELQELYPWDAVEMNDNLLDHTPFHYKRRDRSTPKTGKTATSSSVNGGRSNNDDNDDQMDVDGIDQQTPLVDNIEDDKWIYTVDDQNDLKWILKEPLYIELVNLFNFILSQSFEYDFSPWLLVPTALLEQIVLNLREDAPQFLRFISFHLLEEMIHQPHCKIPSFEQLLSYLVLDSVRSRKIAAKLICQLQLSREYIRNISDSDDKQPKKPKKQSKSKA